MPEGVDSSLAEDENQDETATTVDEVIISNPEDSSSPEQPEEGDLDMPDGTDKFHAIVESEMSQIAQSGRIAQNNFITTVKFADNDYLEGKRIVSLEEAIGVREVASKSVPAGPNVP